MYQIGFETLIFIRLISFKLLHHLVQNTVDELATITNDDIGKDAIYLYPVFEDKWYDLSRAVNGTVTYHTADEFATLFGTSERANDVVVTLLRDATVYSGVVFADGWNSFTGKATFDLRGNTLTKIEPSGTKFVYDETQEKYVEVGTFEETSKYVFSCSKGYMNFTITSSGDKQGTVVSYGIKGNFYYDADGNVVDSIGVNDATGMTERV